MREAERQREEAIAFAQSVKNKMNELEGRLSKIDKSYTSEFETRVKTSMVAAKQALKMQLNLKTLKDKLQLNNKLAALTMDEARLKSMKVAAELNQKRLI